MDLGTKGADNDEVSRRDHPSFQRTVVLARCADCGDVELLTSDLTVRVCLDDGQASYAFRCPSCGIADGQAVSGDLLAKLLLAGVEMVTWHLPLELFERDEEAPVLTESDVAAFLAHLDAEVGQL